MQIWQIWLLLAIVFAALELMGAQFIMLALAASALVVMLVTLVASPDLTGQLIVFLVTAAAITPGFIFWYRRHFQGRENPTGVAGESGYGQRTAQVATRGERVGVELDGNWFPVQFEGGDHPSAGEQVRIVRFEGITAIVIKEHTTEGEAT